MTTATGRGHAHAVIGKISGNPEPITEPQPDGVRMAVQMVSPAEGKFQEYIDTNRKTEPLEVARQGEYAGKTLAICGAGPSLTTSVIEGVDEIFACNSALPFLVSQGRHVTGGVGIDQTPLLKTEWRKTFDVPYFVGSSCDPELVQHLIAEGRRVVFFHNAVGLPDEFDHYCRTWPPTYMVGQGYTVVSRFIGLALWMGFERIDVYGADCALGDGDIAHANGEHVSTAYGNPIIMTGKLPPSPREWRTRPDMLRDAVELARRCRDSKGRVRLMGDTLPVALLGKDDAYLDMVSRTLAPGEAPPSPQ